MAYWRATTENGSTLGRFYNKALMIERLSLRLDVGQRFFASSSKGSRILFEIRTKGAMKRAATVRSKVVKYR